jgi:hypothetical protein
VTGWVLAAAWVVGIIIGINLISWWIERPAKPSGEKAPETLVAEVESAVADVVERLLRDKSHEWHPVESKTVSGKMSGIGHAPLNLAILTLNGPSGCYILMGDEGSNGQATIKRIELQPVQRARIWGAAKLVLDNHTAAQKIEALADVVERIGGGK